MLTNAAFHSRWVALLALALGLMLMISALVELRSTRQELTAALQEQGRTVLALAQRGLENAALSWEVVEAALEQRLLDNARLLAQLDHAGHLDEKILQRIAQENGLFRINLFDSHGRLTLSSHATTGQPPLNAPRRLLQPVLGDSSSELVLGFRQRLFGIGTNFAVAKHRSNGGAIVVNADAAEILSFRRTIGAGSFIKLIGESGDVRYAVVQDSNGILLASPGVRQMSAPDSDIFLKQLQMHETPLSRFTPYQGEEVFEIGAPVRMTESGTAFIRIGLSAASLHRAYQAALWRTGLSTLLLLLTGLLTAGVLLRDLHERRRAEEQRQRQERLMALSHLASGVAHEIRNPLNAVSMVAQRLQREFTPAQDTVEYQQLTGMLVTESRRINEIINQFLQFARPAPLNKIPTRLDALVNHVAALMQSEAAHSGITLSSHCREVREMQADPDKLTQALLNLVRNSLAACENGGHITLSCEAQGERIVIHIEDDGSGIAPEHLGKIFNLYFTTREEGSGLGLSIVQQIVAQHEGTIEVKSEPGQGTRFTISLPAR
ncbi:MAG TPA: ATP-binding protein [bacterium]|nr:ATP-binding protein [bacterium]HQG45320.1 ATP-binding protein [bacterium]HQI48977.1 ATP-binding protein [bacterium]HQJ65599.1 ATP-binding protein [bacterium]